VDQLTAILDGQRRLPFALPCLGQEIVNSDNGVTYTIGHPIDEGGFGQVYECVDQWDHKLVAKVLKPVGPAEEMEIRAHDEIVASDIARSPYAVHLHAAFVFHGATYLISERCALTLHDMLTLEYEVRAAWFRELARALLHVVSHMHQRGLVHCDIHPGNVLIHKTTDPFAVENGVYGFKLGDFGQTRSIENVTVRPSWNENCLPPELLEPAKFGEASHKCDLYQVGLLLLQYLSGEVLQFDASEILEGKPREIAEALPHPVAPALARMLRRHTEWRTASALEAWLEIDQLLKIQ
jgi:serine/threonine protein kinase